ncbi:hypothetical protein BGZ91_010317, partial [Linnemannia elongata]
RIFKAKNRPQDNPLIVHVSSLKMLRSMLKDNIIPDVYDDLIRTYWPGPLTLLFPRSSLIPNEITCGQATVAARYPWSSTVANAAFESTVVDGLRVPPAILRPGGITFEQIRQVKGMEKVQVYKKHFTDAAMEQAPTTPGMKYRHYSPEAEVVLVEYIKTEDSPVSNGSGPTGQYGLILKEIEKLKQEGKKRFGILRTSFTTTTPSAAAAAAVITHQNGTTHLQDDREDEDVIEFPLGQGSKPEDVARELFRGLRYLDDQKVDCIFVEGISEDDEGLAVMNRVRKAASRTISLESTEFL